jgi:cytochrome c peroxidase
LPPTILFCPKANPYSAKNSFFALVLIVEFILKKQNNYQIMKYLFSTLLLFSLTCPSCSDRTANTNRPSIEQINPMYLADIDTLYAQVEQLKKAIENQAPEKAIQAAFFAARTGYKRVEMLAELYNPFTAKKLNQPALPEVEEEDPQIVIEPEGFQVIEELLFPYAPANQAEALKQVEITLVNVKHLHHATTENIYTDAHIFDAMRLEVFRSITLGISGFDSPVAKNSLPEAAAVFATLRRYLALYAPTQVLKAGADGDKTPDRDAQSFRELDQLLAGAEQYLAAHPDFDRFDRAHFITQFANPLASQLLAYQNRLGIRPFTDENRFLRADASTLFAPNVFDPAYFAPAQSRAYARYPKVIDLGKALFYDPLLSGNGQRNCASCHQPDKALTDGLAKSRRLDGKGFIGRNAPSLLNAGLQASLFYEGRVTYMEDQITDVLGAVDEMHSSVPQVVGKLNQHPSYPARFQAAFGTSGAAITGDQFKTALSTYLRSLQALNSRFDQYMRGDLTKLSSQEVNGFNLFMGKAKCGTCHFMPLFNGTVPPVFDRAETEVLGVPARPDTAQATLDPDKGKFNLTKIPLHTFAFKTTTARNAEVTAPYMHNGVYKNLEQLIDFYNRGGGAGIGIELEHQTLPPDPLLLTGQEKADLIAFMKALTDTGSGY